MVGYAWIRGANPNRQRAGHSASKTRVHALKANPPLVQADRSKPVARLRRLHIGSGVGWQQQALGDERISRSLHLRHIVGARPIALLERKARIAHGFALGPGLAEGDERAVAVAQLVRLLLIDVPAGIGRDRKCDSPDPATSCLVAVSVDRRAEG